MPVKSGLRSAVRGVGALWLWPYIGTMALRIATETAAPAARIASPIRVRMPTPRNRVDGAPESWGEQLSLKRGVCQGLSLQGVKPVAEIGHDRRREEI